VIACADCGLPMRRVCRDCQQRRARAGLLLHQRRFLQTWAVGQIDLRLRDWDGVTHVELYDDPWHAFCGVTLLLATGRRRTRTFPVDVCPGCRDVFDGLVARYTVGVV
jgi:hypothetical protein